jgi:hypothetical protein
LEYNLKQNKMKLTKKTIEKCAEAGANLYTAKKVTNKNGTWITVTYASRYFKDGVCVALSTTQKTDIEGSTQEDIVNHFSNK